jgi:hypothetical protein
MSKCSAALVHCKEGSGRTTTLGIPPIKILTLHHGTTGKYNNVVGPVGFDSQKTWVQMFDSGNNDHKTARHTDDPHLKPTLTAAINLAPGFVVPLLVATAASNALWSHE